MLSQLGRLVLGYGVLVLGDQLATISWTRRLQTDHQHWGDIATVTLSNETWRLRMQRNHGCLGGQKGNHGSCCCGWSWVSHGFFRKLMMLSQEIDVEEKTWNAEDGRWRAVASSWHHHCINFMLFHVWCALPERFRLLARSFQHVLHHGGGRTELAPGPDHCFYLGELENRSGDITASMSTCNGQLSGMLMKGRQIFLIDPVFGTSDQYWLRAVNKQISQLQHDVLRFLAPKSSQGRRTAGATTKYIEVLVVNDFARYTAFGGQDGLVQLATHTVAVMNAVTAIYRKAPSDGAVFPYTAAGK